MDNKQIFLHDLCTRLPYGVKVKRPDNGSYDYVSAIDVDADTLTCVYNGYTDKIEKFIPYLRPMSSMTEEEKEEYCQLQAKFLLSAQYPVTDAYEIFDWLNRKMFDYRGLIPQGLALEAPEDLYQF